MEYTSFMNKLLDDKDRIKCLLKFNNNEAFTNLSFLKKKSDVCSILDKMDEDDKSYHLESIDMILKELNKKSYNKLRIYYQDYKQKEDEGVVIKTLGELPSGELNWNNILLVFDYYKRKVDLFKDKDSISKSEFNTLFKYLLLGLTCGEPLRRNVGYFNMKIIYKYKTSLASSHNYYAVKSNTFYFDDKSSFLKEELTDVMKSIMDIYLKFHPLYKKSDAKSGSLINFFINYDGSAITHESIITKYYTSIFSNFGSNINLTIIRRVYNNEFKSKPSVDTNETIMITSFLSPYKLKYIDMRKKNIILLCDTSRDSIRLILTSNHDRFVIIKDTSGKASINNISIEVIDSSIDGSDRCVIKSDYGRVTLYCFNDKWFDVGGV